MDKENYNYVQLIGKISKVYKNKTSNGHANLKIILVTKREKFVSEDGETKGGKLDFHTITLWRKDAEKYANFLKENQIVKVVGEINYEKKDDGKLFVNIIPKENIKIIQDVGVN